MSIDIPQGVELTALVMAQDRRIESARTDRLFDDPLAGTLLAAAGGSLAGAGSLGDLCPPLDGYVAFRTRYVDERLKDALAQGVRQVVLLAAGLDTRAYRLGWPAGARVFELDLPDLLAFKRAALADARPGCGHVTIPVDLREDWPAALAAAGYRDDVPTAWVVEGLLPYLTDADADRLAGRTHDRSAPGSRLILDHAYPAAHSSPAFASGRDTLAGNASPLASAVDDPVRWLADRGWTGHVADPADLARRYDRTVPPALGAEGIFWLADAVV